MISRHSGLFFVRTAVIAVFWTQFAYGGSQPMKFLDVLKMRTVGAGTLSDDGKLFAYTLSSLDWRSGKRHTEIWVTDAGDGKTRQLTFTADKDESAPAFSPGDGRWLGFLSNRNGAAAGGAGAARSGGSAVAGEPGSSGAGGANQLYLISPSGGEARKISDQAGDVTSFAFSEDGKWVAYVAGKADQRQIYLYSLQGGGSAAALTKHVTGVVNLAWSPDSTVIYFLAPDTVDVSERRRVEAKFDVKIANQEQSPRNLWQVKVDTRAENRLTNGDTVTVREFKVSHNGMWISYSAQSTNRWIDPLDHDEEESYVLNLATGKTERITENKVRETGTVVSPDGKWVAMTAPEGFNYFRRDRLYLRPIGGAGGAWKVLAADWPGDMQDLAWSADGKRVYFRDGVGTSSEMFSVDVASGLLSQLTQLKGVADVDYHAETDQFVVKYENAVSPADYYLAKATDLGRRDSWRRMSDSNPEVEKFALGQYEVVQWKSSDGQTVEGILVKPVGYEAGKKYPLVVQLHGGPASAYMMNFSGSYGTYVHVFAANGYAVLQPNYRGSTNYGEKFRTQIAGDYFRQAFDDIMTGVDEMVKRGVADESKLGLMGWSAGGHWSNWALTHTDRFKAISTGAGASNWISMYAQTDVRRVREHYFQGTPYDNWDHFVTMSPLKYIKNAKTPTLIHCGHDDPRVPRPQSEELYTALKKLGVPVEFIVYPRMGHGITEPRYQMVKMASEFYWFEKWIKGRKEWLDWKELLETIPADESTETKSE